LGNELKTPQTQELSMIWNLLSGQVFNALNMYLYSNSSGQHPVTCSCEQSDESPSYMFQAAE